MSASDPRLTRQRWYAFNGDKLKINEPANKPLFDVIGVLYGGDGVNFNLPDLRGYFVMGAGGKRNVSAAQIASTATGPRTTPFTTDTSPDHTHTVGNVPYSTHTIDVVAGWDLAENNSTETPTSTEGGAHARDGRRRLGVPPHQHLCGLHHPVSIAAEPLVQLLVPLIVTSAMLRLDPVRPGP